MALQAGQKVNHAKHGLGDVLVATGTTAVVRFESGILEVLASELSEQHSFYETLQLGRLHSTDEVILRLQAELIRHLNDSWGVFSRSRIALLPHQLWVCRQVLQTWPPRWLVADDVGLGKTVEAGLILWPLLSRRQVTRLLIIAPASLTAQWQARMKQMFDIRLTVYETSQDRPAPEGSTYWDIHNQVVVSLQTLREDRNGRHERLLNADPWDLVIVDEAHHLSAHEESGASLGYNLLRTLQEAGRVQGLLLFTATPHRGKDYGFLALLHLLRPDLFTASQPLATQLAGLRETVIRNNKQTVTDLRGEKLFISPLVASEVYRYTPEEARFYQEMSAFIASGQAYASTLTSSRDRRAVGLVLTSLQKLASSSVAAVTQALRRRTDKVQHQIGNLEKELAFYRELAETDPDQAAVMEELIGSWTIPLMRDEKRRIEELLELAREVRGETKIKTILAALEERFPERSVLLFSEYKATQSLLLTELTRRYGREQVTFINGDGRALVDGEWMDTPREQAASAFNAGKVRFLVSTEAAGEGIDLQQSCHTLIHVDLPWNPMRLHQRVGRLNRYGQTRRVEVMSLRNPGTVEARIWELLTEKLDSINQAFANVMDEPEDLAQLVLGMTSPALFSRVFAHPERSDMQEWFDEQTAALGGHGVVEAVEALVGHSARFDFQEVSPLIPRVDLPDLLPFMRRILRFNHRSVKEDGTSLSFKTPELWLREFGVRRDYRNLSFSREGKDDVGGVGHRIVDQAVAQAREFRATVAAVGGGHLEGDLYIYRVAERVTDRPGHRVTLVGRFHGTKTRWLRDWELLKLLGEAHSSGQATLSTSHLQLAEHYRHELLASLDTLSLHYLSAHVEPFALLMAEK